MISKNKIPPDFWKNIKGSNFNCNVLVSPYNRRITVYTFSFDRQHGHHGVQEMVNTLTILALNHGLDKIWLKTPAKWAQNFKEAGMEMEAAIPGFYKGTQTAQLLSLFLTAERKTPSTSADFNWKLVLSPGRSKTKKRPGTITLAWGKPEHSAQLARLYSRVFSTYPFPVFDPGYIKYTMNNDVRYITAWHNKNLVAAASAEINREGKNAELTDFATLPEYRAQGLAKLLLKELEKHLQKENFHCLYTIARSGSTGMNKTFQDSGYTFRGVLINNCNIGGDLEDMNVWSKNI